MRVRLTALISAVILFLFFCLSLYAGDFALPQYLIETKDLMTKLGEKGLIIVDVRKAEDYKDGHIQGAINLPVKLTQGTVKGVKDLMLPVEKLEELFGSKGISHDSNVVIYEEHMGDNATRLFWTLDVFGHKKMSVLNGGFNKWAKEGRPIATEITTLPPTKYTAKLDVLEIATLEDVKQRLGRKDVVLVDCRSEKEYTGEVASREVARAGHIPGAIGIDWVKNLTTKDGFKVLKSADELLTMYEKAGVTKDKEVIAYCRTGMRSSNTYFVLKLLGYPKVRNYDGSMIEWGNIPDLPLEKK